VVNVQNTTALFVFGPRVSHHMSRFTPYGQVLFGVACMANSRRVNAVTDATETGLLGVTTNNLFPGPRATDSGSVDRFPIGLRHDGGTAGGGIDIKINKHIGFRPVAVDYLLTRFQSLTTGKQYNQNNLRASAGIVFTFGAQ
jgi:hypothetical protein